MKAAYYSRYGPPESLQLKNVPKPVPGDQDVLIKLHATTVNRTDCGFLRGEPKFARVIIGLSRPKYKILGNDFAGEIEAAGKNVTHFKPGDRVFGHSGVKFGAHAEYMTMQEDDSLTTIPDGLSYKEAAPIMEGAHYAYCSIRAAKITEDHKILVNGATGAIGSAAVQLIKALGAEVTAVCNTPNLDLVKSLGADKVIDYTREDFTKINQQFDVVFDAVGKSTFAKCKPLLKKGGIYTSTELGPYSQNPFLALITPLLGGKKVLFAIPIISSDEVAYIKNLVETDKFKPVIDRYYPFDQIIDAYKYVETGQKTGNVVVTILDN